MLDNTRHDLYSSTCIPPKDDSPIPQSPKEDPSGAIDISVNYQSTPSTPEHLPPSQLGIHPSTAAARFAGPGLGDKGHLLAEFLCFEGKPLPKPGVAPREHLAHRLAADLASLAP